MAPDRLSGDVGGSQPPALLPPVSCDDDTDHLAFCWTENISAPNLFDGLASLPSAGLPGTGLQHHNQTHAPQQTIMAVAAAVAAAAAAVEAAAVVAAAAEEAAVEAEEEVVVVAARVAPSAASCWRPSGWNC